MSSFEDSSPTIESFVTVFADEGCEVILPAKCHRRRSNEVEGEGCLIFGHGLDPVKSDHERDEYVKLVEAACSNIEHMSFISYSARGHGKSRGWQQAEDIQFLWSNLSKDMAHVAQHFAYRRYVVGGHSMGAATALCCAMQNPDKVQAIVLVRPPTAWETRRERKNLLLNWAASIKKREEQNKVAANEDQQSPCLYRVLTGAAETDLPARPELDGNATSGSGGLVVVESSSSGSSSSRSSNNSNNNNNNNTNNSSSSSCSSSSSSSVRSGDISSSSSSGSSSSSLSWASWSDIKCPVLILAYKNDDAHPVSTSEHLLKLIPHAELHIMEDEGEAKLSWQKIIEEFLSKLGEVA